MNDEDEPKGNPLMKSMAIWGAIILGLMLIMSILGSGGKENADALSYSAFRTQVENGNVKSIVITDDLLSAETNDGRKISTVPINSDTRFYDLLNDKGVDIKAQADEGPSLLLLFLYQALPFLLILGIAFFILKQMQKGGGGGAMSFGKSKAKLLTEKHGKVTFADVAGIDEAREELEEIVEFLKDSQKFSRLGGKIPKGALLVGSPGTGKTLLARAIAGEAGVPFFTISGSDFVEMFVGVGASRVRDMFEQAKKNAPCILFIDEIDAVGRSRGGGIGNQNDEREQTLNQLLVEMDGFEANEGIIIIAATNRPDVLDPALLRPGRFDRQVTVPLPDIKGRKMILDVHMKKVPMAPDVDSHVIARGTPGFSGAELANLVNEAALLAARRSKKLVAMSEFEEAKDKVMMGTERKSMVMSEDEKKMTAYHEAGHAVVGYFEPAADPIHKATIIPRGRALGMVMQLPEKDQTSMHLDQMHARISIFMAGQIAEKLIFGKDRVSAGASSDIQGATNIATAMVTQWGLSKLGPVQYEQQGQNYLGQSGAQRRPMSDQTAQAIDDEIKGILDKGYKRSESLLKKHDKEFHRVAEALLEYETLTGDDIKILIEGGKITRDDNDNKPSKPIQDIGTMIPKSGKGKGSASGANPQAI